MRRLVILALAAASPALAQEAMYTAAATMASPHTIILREQVHLWRLGSDPVRGTDSTEVFEAETSIQYGLARGWSGTLDVPITQTNELTPGGESSDTGIDEVAATFKYRFYQHDSGGVDTIRAAAMFGSHLGLRDSGRIDPHAGVVLTMVRGRYGFNQELGARLNTGGDEIVNHGGEGPAEALVFNTSALYRIVPAAFTAESKGAWYVTGEVNGLYETNGDVELRWSPGLMYEGRDFAFELMAQLPLWADVDERAELDWGVGFGFRFLY